MNDLHLIEFFKANGYENVTKINNKWCGLIRLAFTSGLVVGLNQYGYERRYCFHTWSEALESLLVWDGIDHPSGNWIKCKGTYKDFCGDIPNPNYEINK
jgi:hypothetical protein